MSLLCLCSSSLSFLFSFYNSFAIENDNEQFFCFLFLNFFAHKKRMMMSL
jgi:hypothetical protein